MKIAHRDIKPDNVLYEMPNFSDPGCDLDKVRVKLTDFGFATFYDRDRSTMKLGLGSERYMAPELFKFQKHSYKVDIWALGVMTYFLLAGAHIWPANNREELKEMILGADPNVDLVKQKHGRQAANFILKCL